MDITNVGHIATELGSRLEKPADLKFTGKSFRRSVCTQLVEAGISVIGLCEAGNWKSLNTTWKYAEHSNKSAASRMDMLDGNKRELTDYTDLPAKRVALSVAAVESTGTSNCRTNTNCMIISINSTNVYGLSDIVAQSYRVEKYGQLKCD